LRPSPTSEKFPACVRLSGHSPIRVHRGTIKEAIVDVSGEQYIDLELEALAMMKRE
jgi:hypothetical protein